MTNAWHYTGTIMGLLSRGEYTAVANLAGDGRFDDESLRKVFAGQGFERPDRESWNEGTTTRRSGADTFLLSPIIRLGNSEINIEFRVDQQTERCYLHRITHVNNGAGVSHPETWKQNLSSERSQQETRAGTEMRVGDVLNSEQINDLLAVALVYQSHDSEQIARICCEEIDPHLATAAMAGYEGAVIVPNSSRVADLVCAVWPDHMRVTLPLLPAGSAFHTRRIEPEDDAVALLTVRIGTALPEYTYCLQDVVASY